MNTSTAHAIRSSLWTVLILAGPAPLATTTSATVSGYVRTTAGEPIAAARIDIVHTPSGTAATATTAENGAFYQSGLRVGGPYEIRISANAYRDRKLDSATLKPGTQPPLAVTLVPLDIEEVIVTASPLVSERDLNNWPNRLREAAPHRVHVRQRQPPGHLRRRTGTDRRCAADDRQRQTDCLYRFNRFRSVASAYPSASQSVYRIRFGVHIDL